MMDPDRVSKTLLRRSLASDAVGTALKALGDAASVS